MKKIMIALFSTLLFTLPSLHAHCPLCTMGAAAAAGGALWLGVKGIVVALFVGAFAVSMGWVVTKMIKKTFIPLQNPIIILISFITTVLPLLPSLMTKTPADYYPVLVAVAGDYGSLLNKTYLINLPLIASLLGAMIVMITPYLSKQISNIRYGKLLPFQGTVLTLALLMMIAAVLQLL